MEKADPTVTPAARPGRQRWFLRAVAISGGMLLAVVLAEVALRLTARGATLDRWAVPHPRYGFIHQPRFQQTVVRPWVNTTYVWHVSINSLGFRGPEPNLTDTNQIRILLLGDSFTFGYGVEYEQTFGALLEQRLRAAGIPAVVFNAGVTGWGSAQEFIFAADHFDLLKPDFIIVTFCENDPIEDEIFSRGGAKGVLPSFPGKRWLRDHLRLYGVVYNVVSAAMYNRYLLQKKIEPQPTRADSAASETNAPLEVRPVDRFGGLEWYYRTMDLFRSFTQRYRDFNPAGRVIVQVVEFWRNDFRDVMRVLENEGHIRFVDLRENVGSWTPEQVKLPFDPHWNPAMHKISADRLAHEVQSLLESSHNTTNPVTSEPAP